MHKHALNAVLQGDCARVASPASTAQLQKNLAVDETSELNVTTILLDSRANASLEQFLDHADNLTVILIVLQRVLLDCLLFTTLSRNRVYKRLSRCHGLGNQSKDLRLDVRPWGGRVFCNGNVVGTIEDG